MKDDGRARQLRLKLGAQIAVAAGATLVVAGTSFIVYDAYTFRSFLQHELEAQAVLIASQTSASLSFGDLDAAHEVLHTLGGNGRIKSAALCDRTGAALAVHRAPGVSIADVCRGDNETLRATASVVADTEGLATLVLIGEAAQANARTWRFSMVVVALMAPAMMLALLLAARVRATVEIFRTIEEALERAEAAAHAKSEFLANMSHEIRTPLNGLIGSTELLLESGLGADQHELADTSRRCAEALASVVNDVLDISRLEAGPIEIERAPVVVRDIVEAVRSLFFVTARQKEVALSVDVDETVPDAMLSDAHRLRHVLSNLVGNALKFTSEGSVRVAVTTPREATIRFSIVDTGIGVPPDKRASIFTRFEQADASTTRRYGGTGLGLAIAKGFVEQMGGVIRVEDGDQGVGSRFVVELPCTPSTLPVVVPPVVEATSETAAEQRVLLCEDNPVNRMVATRMLKRLGCAVIEAEDGLEAIDRWAEMEFDLILMDCQMPNLDGYDATEEIRRREEGSGRARVPIVALTANVLPEDLERCVASGMDGHVAKPVSIKALETTTQRLAGRRA